VEFSFGFASSAPRGWSDRKRTAPRRSDATDRGPTALLEPCRYWRLRREGRRACESRSPERRRSSADALVGGLPLGTRSLAAWARDPHSERL